MGLVQAMSTRMNDLTLMTLMSIELDKYEEPCVLFKCVILLCICTEINRFPLHRI